MLKMCGHEGLFAFFKCDTSVWTQCSLLCVCNMSVPMPKCAFDVCFS